MAQNPVEEFNAYRSKMNDKMLADNTKIIKRIFNLDTNAFTAGALDKRTKELLGLGNSLVLRCDDCVKYHLEECHKRGITKEKMIEGMSVSLLT
jgi:AhpD family alkylhydroperoxidase